MIDFKNSDFYKLLRTVSSLMQLLWKKNIGMEFTYLCIPSLCKECFVMRHNFGHSVVCTVHNTSIKQQKRSNLCLEACTLKLSEIGHTMSCDNRNVLIIESMKNVSFSPECFVLQKCIYLLFDKVIICFKEENRTIA